MNRQYLFDVVAANRFDPSQEIRELAVNTTMTSEAKRYFFASAARLQAADQFNQNCPSQAESSIILGCYSGGKIYIYNVTDERLAGIREVTAAHEMLHAAYDRLPEQELQRVNTLLENEIQNIKNERLKNVFAMYQQSEPDQQLNEAHSIVATEVRVISDELEHYYLRYFVNRQQIVAYSEQYESVFNDIRSQQDAIAVKLQVLSDQIANRSNALNLQSQQLSEDIKQYNTRAETPGGFTSQGSADRERNDLMVRREQLQQERAVILSLIEEAKELEKEYHALLGELKNLNNIIDSTPEEVPDI